MTTHASNSPDPVSQAVCARWLISAFSFVPDSPLVPAVWGMFTIMSPCITVVSFCCSGTLFAPSLRVLPSYNTLIAVFFKSQQSHPYHQQHTNSGLLVRLVHWLLGKQRSDSMYYHLTGWWEAGVEPLPSPQYWNRGILTPIRPHHHHSPLCCTKIPCRLLSLSLFLSAFIHLTPRSPLCLLANSSSSSIPTQGKMSSKLPAGKQKPTSPFRKRGSLQYAASTGKSRCFWSIYKMSCFPRSRSQDKQYRNALTINLQIIIALPSFVFLLLFFFLDNYKCTRPCVGLSRSLE